MDTIVITGSPGSGKTTTSNCLSEIFRERNIHHIVIDPDEIARIFPEDSLSKLKLDALAKLYPLYQSMGVQKIIIPMTIDDNNDNTALETIVGKQHMQIFNLMVAKDIAVKRVIEREPNEYWQNKLSNIVSAYYLNEHARTFECTDINTDNQSAAEIAQTISTIVSKDKSR